MFKIASAVAAFALIAFGAVDGAMAHPPEEHQPKAPKLEKQEMKLPEEALLPEKPPPPPSPREKALLAQVQALEKQRDGILKRLMKVDQQRLQTTDPAERKRLDQQKMALVQELNNTMKRHKSTRAEWQKAMVERWKKANPNPPPMPGRPMPPGMVPPPEVLSKQIQVAQEQLDKLKKQGKPDSDPQVKMYQERIARYKSMLKMTGTPPVSRPPADNKK